MIKPSNSNSEVELSGLDFVALVKSLDLPGSLGQHFFFDAGNGDCCAHERRYGR